MHGENQTKTSINSPFPFLFCSVLFYSFLTFWPSLPHCIYATSWYTLKTFRQAENSQPRLQSQVAFYRNSCRQVEAEAASAPMQLSRSPEPCAGAVSQKQSAASRRGAQKEPRGPDRNFGSIPCGITLDPCVSCNSADIVICCVRWKHA